MRHFPEFFHPVVGDLRALRHHDFMVRSFQQFRSLFDQLGQCIREAEQTAVHILLQQTMKACVDDYVESAQQGRDHGDRIQSELGAKAAQLTASSL